MLPTVPSARALRTLSSQSRSYIRQACAHVTVPFTRRPSARSQHNEACRTLPCSQASTYLRVGSQARKQSSYRPKSSRSHLEQWELTVGIEIHAELSTTCKLFSSAGTSLTSPPNTHTALFDTSIPGAQPQLQKEVLLPALRAALALNCEIQEQSGWDRKHYFWWDQPQGYQITQYYRPFAKNGQLVLYLWDGIDPKDASSDLGEIHIGIKQIQLEQDTAKTVLQPPETYLLDLNRAGVPLVEIITRPEIKSPRTAAAVVKKIQGLLQSVGANSTGMEMGGLRADVNVSVHSRNEHGHLEYDGVTGLSQRTEIKNLSSVKAVEDAIVAERDRQIGVIENGGVIEGETRGWTLGATTTRRLRSKESEVDYRYMPDPDLEPLCIGRDLVEHVRAALPYSPTEAVKALTATKENAYRVPDDPLRGHHGLSVKDAKTLVSLDEGERLEFYLSILHIVLRLPSADAEVLQDRLERAGRTVCNWVLMEIPTYLASVDQNLPYQYALSRSSPGDTKAQQPSEDVILSSPAVAGLIYFVLRGDIKQQSARALLKEMQLVFPGEDDDVHVSRQIESREGYEHAKDQISGMISQHDLWFKPLQPEDMKALARQVIQSNEDMAIKARQELVKTQGKRRGKMMWFVGQMIRNAEEGTIDAKEAERYIYTLLVEKGAPG